MPETTKAEKKSAFSRVSFERNLVLSHHLTQRLHKRFYNTLDHVLFVSTKVLRAQHRDEESQRIEDAVRCLCERMEVDMKTAFEKLSKAAKASDISQSLAHSDSEASIKVEFSTGCSLRILDLFSQLDRLLLLIETLELHNICSSDESSKLLRFWNGEFRHFLTALLAIRHKLNNAQKQESEDDAKH